MDRNETPSFRMARAIGLPRRRGAIPLAPCAPTSPATRRSRAVAARWLAVALVHLSTFLAVNAAAEVVLQTGVSSSCSIAWGQGGLSNQIIGRNIDELPFSFSESSDPGQLEAFQTTTVTAVTGGFRVASQGSAGTLFDVGIGEGGSQCSIRYCADGGEPYSVTLGLQAAGDRDRTPTDPATAIIQASLQSGFAPFTFANATRRSSTAAAASTSTSPPRRRRRAGSCRGARCGARSAGWSSTAAPSPRSRPPSTSATPPRSTPR